MKILKKIVLIVFLIALIVLDFFIIKNFETNTLKYGIIDKNEKTKVDFKYSMLSVMDLFEDYEYIHAYKENFLGDLTEVLYIDLNGKEYTRASSKNDFKEEVLEYNENRAIQYDENEGTYGYIDWEKKKTSEFIYDYADNYEEGFAKVGIYNDENELKYGIIDLDGKQVIPCIYDDIDTYLVDVNVFGAEDGENYYLLKEDGNKMAEYIDNTKIRFLIFGELSELDEIDIEEVMFSKKYIIMKKDNKYGLFTKDGEKKIDFEYDNLVFLAEEIILAEKSGEKSIINSDSNIVIDIKKIEQNGLELDSICENRIRVVKNNKYGILDFEGNIIINPEYDTLSIQTAEKGYFCIGNDDQYGLIDLDGNEIIKCSSKYKNPIIGNGEYFITEEYNMKLFVLWVVVLITTFIIEIIIIVKVLRRKNEPDKENS